MSKHTDDQIQAAVARFEQWAAGLRPEDFEDVADLRAVAQATDAIRTDQAQLREAVSVARLNGRSWSEIGIALGVSRQSARERFSEKVHG